MFVEDVLVSQEDLKCSHKHLRY